MPRATSTTTWSSRATPAPRPSKTITRSSCSESSPAWRACARSTRSCACWAVESEHALPSVPLLQLSQVSLAYGHVPLLDHVDLVVEPGERIGLIGRNGTGKSSLLKIIEGLAAADDGKVWRAPQLKLASVPQEPAFRPGQTAFEAVAEGLGKGTQLLVDYHAATHAPAQKGSPPDAAL